MEGGHLPGGRSHLWRTLVVSDVLDPVDGRVQRRDQLVPQLSGQLHNVLLVPSKKKKKLEHKQSGPFLYCDVVNTWGGGGFQALISD